MLAAKASLATRVDALGDEVNINLGAEHKAKLEARLRILEEGNVRRISGTGKAKAKFEKYQGVSEIKQYPDAADSTLPSTSKRKRSDSELKVEPEETEEKPKLESRKKKRSESEMKVEEEEEGQQPEIEVQKKKKKKKAKQEEEVVEGIYYWLIN